MSSTPTPGWGPQPDGETYIPPPPGFGPPPLPGYGPSPLRGQFYGPPIAPYQPRPLRPVPPPRRGSGGWWKIPVLAVLLIFVIGGLIGLSKGTRSSPSRDATSSSSDTSTTVTYRVTSPQATIGDITWGTPHFSSAQVSGTAEPWSHDVPWPGSFDGLGVIVVAQNGPEDTAITCTILINGQQVASNTSSGPYSVVTCTNPTS